MSSDGVVFNIHGNVNQAASKIVNKDAHVGDVNNFGGVPTVADVLHAVESVVPPEAHEDTIAPIRALAALPVSEQKTEEKKQEALNLWQRLAPYKSQIAKAVLSFGEASLAALASTNPAMIGLLALVKAVKPKEDPKESENKE